MVVSWYEEIEEGRLESFSPWLMPDYNFLAPFFVHRRLRHLKLGGGWFGYDEDGTVSETSSPTVPVDDDEIEIPYFPTENDYKKTPLLSLDLVDCFIPPQVLKCFLAAPTAMIEFSLVEFFTPSERTITDIPCQEYVAALLPQKDSLQSIRLHLFKTAEGLRTNSRSTLTTFASFARLTRLSVDLCTLFGGEHDTDFPWLGVRAYFPPSLEVLELRTTVGETPRHSNNFAIRTLLNLSNECKELPRLRKVQIMEILRKVLDDRGAVRPAPMINYSQIHSQFQANGVDLKLRGYNYLDPWGFVRPWDTRRGRGEYEDNFAQL